LDLCAKVRSRVPDERFKVQMLAVPRGRPLEISDGESKVVYPSKQHR
jgi:hypothetical protein